MSSTIYLTEPGLIVHRQDERLIMRRSKEVVSDVPLMNVKQVVVIGRGVEVTTEAMLAMVERRIDLCFFSRGMQFKARVMGESSYFGHLRFLQARYVDSPEKQLELAKEVVRGKLYNQARVLFESQKGQAKKIAQYADSVVMARDLETLRGYEGYGAALYFEGLRQFIPKEWGFERRDYFPPPDPINALLSFGYSLLTREALAAAYLVGLDPYLGFFHAIDYGRPSLALDLVEEFRPIVVDLPVLDLIASKVITLADFEVSVGEDETGKRRGIRLNPQARHRFLETYEKRMSETFRYDAQGQRQRLRRIIELQTRQIANIITGEREKYIPFRLDG